MSCCRSWAAASRMTAAILKLGRQPAVLHASRLQLLLGQLQP